VYRTMTALGAALAVSAASATAAGAQGAYGTQGQSKQQQQPRGEAPRAKSGATVTIAGRKVPISAEFAKAFQELQAAVDANDTATIQAKLTAANAAAKTPEERYLAAQLRLKAATTAKNDAELAAALDAMLATGIIPQEQLSVAYMTLGKSRFNLKQYDQAAAAFEKELQLNPGNGEALSLLARTRVAQGRQADAVALLQSAIGRASAGGAKPPEDLYKRAVAVAYQAKLPVAAELARQWVAAYPSQASWNDALGIYRNLNQLDEGATLEVLRLARVVKVLKSASDYDRYAYRAITTGFPGEAKAVLAEGVAAGVVDPGKSPFKELIAEANAKSAGEQATLAAAAAKGLAAPTAKAAVATGDLLYGYGQYAKAAEVYRAALGKPGADPNLINLHLGMALAQAGDKAGATAAFNAVSGPRADLAKYWLIYLSTRP